jgi:hypothetical protein
LFTVAQQLVAGRHSPLYFICVGLTSISVGHPGNLLKLRKLKGLSNSCHLSSIGRLKLFINVRDFKSLRNNDRLGVGRPGGFYYLSNFEGLGIKFSAAWAWERMVLFYSLH